MPQIWPCAPPPCAFAPLQPQQQQQQLTVRQDAGPPLAAEGSSAPCHPQTRRRAGTRPPSQSTPSSPLQRQRGPRGSATASERPPTRHSPIARRDCGQTHKPRVHGPRRWLRCSCHAGVLRLHRVATPILHALLKYRTNLAGHGVNAESQPLALLLEATSCGWHHGPPRPFSSWQVCPNPSRLSLRFRHIEGGSVVAGSH